MHKTIKHVRIESNEGNYMCRPDVQPLVPWVERLGIELVDRWRPGVIYFQVEDYSEDYSESDVPRIVQDHSDRSDGSEDGEQEDEEEEEDVDLNVLSNVELEAKIRKMKEKLSMVHHPVDYEDEGDNDNY